MNKQLGRANARWSLELGEVPTGPPVLVDDDVLVSTRDASFAAAGVATVHAIDSSNGQVRWQKQFSQSSISNLLIRAVPEPLVLIAVSSHHLLQGQGEIVALDPDGNTVWNWSADAQTISGLGARDDDLFFATGSGFLIILDSRSGHEWKRFPLDPPPSVAAPLVYNGVIYVPCRGPLIVAHSVTGELLWEFNDEESGWLHSTPLPVGERVVVTSSAGVVLALDAGSGAAAWRRKIDPEDGRLSAPASDGERLYVGARHGLFALDLADGRPLWHFPTERPAEAQPVCQSSTVYMVSHDHYLYALDAVTGAELWRHEMGRRIEVAPALRQSEKGMAVIVADRGGTVDALSLHRDAQRTDAQVDVWASAAASYEAENDWVQAAKMWKRLGRPNKQAKALKKYAESLRDSPDAPGEKAAAWEAAAAAFEEGGDWKQADVCRRLVAEHRQLPIISLDVKHEKLILDSWSRLRFIVRNQGFGPAHRLVIRAEGERFDGQVASTQTISTLAKNQERVEWLDVRPREYGETVPLRVSVYYDDVHGAAHSSSEVIYIAVARSESAQTGSGQTVGVIDPLRQMTDDESEQFVQLRESLTDAFSKEELYTLALELGLDYEMLPEAKDSFIRELLLYLWRRRRLDDLLALCEARRPHLRWDES